MRILEGHIKFESNEKAIWESLLERPIDRITAQELRDLGQERVSELTERGYHLWSKMASRVVAEIPKTTH